MEGEKISSKGCGGCKRIKEIDQIVRQTGVELVDASMAEIARGSVVRAGELITAGQVFVDKADELDGALVATCTGPDKLGDCTAKDTAQIEVMEYCFDVLAAKLGEPGLEDI